MMNYSLNIRPVVYEELEEAQDWYEQKQPGLGDRFEDCFQATLERILKMPLFSPVIHSWQGASNRNEDVSLHTLLFCQR